MHYRQLIYLFEERHYDWLLCNHAMNDKYCCELFAEIIDLWVQVISYSYSASISLSCFAVVDMYSQSSGGVFLKSKCM